VELGDETQEGTEDTGHLEPIVEPGQRPVVGVREEKIDEEYCTQGQHDSSYKNLDWE
jgi:hypothetical protein